MSEGDFSAAAVPAWLGYLRPARDRHEQNLEALRDPARGLIYVRTLREIVKGEELLVWYGDELARECGIPILSPANIRGKIHLLITVSGTEAERHITAVLMC